MKTATTTPIFRRKWEKDRQRREDYILKVIATEVAEQVRTMRLNSHTPDQAELAEALGTKQPRISNLENPGTANVTVRSLARLAAHFGVGLQVRFVPFSAMVKEHGTLEVPHPLVIKAS